MEIRIGPNYQQGVAAAAKSLEESLASGVIQAEDCYSATITLINVALQSTQTDAATRAKLEEAAQTIHHLMVPHNDKHHGPLN
ncbi:hypothetical protein [Pseudoalteromonas sp. S1688]|uniref:hypothetical protein n=1 Tax=Pseudoalteromonas sp. S1688 TaxID=579511 RepID=UPI00110B0A25|nr:hypothetical protein [Pseudoalteromonas sp. S1688]TMP45479.1 hypothetical protein CWB81_19375 [Pseudoalteromonas sp. S1688]